MNVRVARRVDVDGVGGARRGGAARSRRSSATGAGCWCGRSGTEPLVRVMVEAPTRSRRPSRRRPAASPRSSAIGSSASAEAAPRLPSDVRTSWAWCAPGAAARRRIWRRSCGCSAEAAARLGPTCGDPTRPSLHEAAADAVHDVDRQLREGDGVAGARRRPGRAGRARPPRRPRRERLAAIEARLDAMAAHRRRRHRGAERGADRVQGRVWAIRRDRLGTARRDRGPRWARPVGRPRSRRSTRSRSRCRRSTGSRCAAATPPACTCSSPATVSISPTRRRAAGRGAQRRIRCSRRARCASPTATSRSSTRPRPRSVSSATTPRALRAQIRDDELLRLALRAETAEASVLAHTRWASVGIISEPNAHPLNQEELDGDGRRRRSPYVDRRAQRRRRQLRRPQGARRRCDFPAEITTDAKVIPALVVAPASRPASSSSRRSARRSRRSRARSRSRAQSAADPDRLLLALRGSGQALYVGLGDDCFVVASEPYGVVEECDALPAPRRRDDARRREPGEPGPGRGARRGAARERRRASRGCRTTGASCPVDEARAAACRRSRRATSTAATRRTTS